MNWLLNFWCKLRGEQMWYCYFECETHSHTGKGRITVRDVGKWDREKATTYVRAKVEAQIKKKLDSFTITGWDTVK